VSESASRTGTPLPPFEWVVEQYGPALLRFCAARAGAAAAQDCLQETLLAALRAYGELREAGSLRAWLYAIAARKALDVHRGRARAAQPQAGIEELAAVEPAARRDGALWAQVAQLPPKQREAVELRYLGELAYREIAELMQTSEAAARRSVFEGLRRLRAQVRP
jgi:RNA polymerase sigma factor (sigma-70 family)